VLASRQLCTRSGMGCSYHSGCGGGALAVGLMQTRGLFSTYPLRFDIRRALPSAGRLLQAGRRDVEESAESPGGGWLACWTLGPTLSEVAHLAAHRRLSAGGVRSAWREAGFASGSGRRSLGGATICGDGTGTQGRCA